jgi:ABC-type bacteriocin/lantibiotic exporter with double-glycine peptidase domain
MNIVSQLLYNFVNKEITNIVFLFISCIALNVIQIKNLSHITAEIINNIQNRKEGATHLIFKSFVLFTVIFLVIYYIYRTFQNDLLTKLRQWVRSELVKLLLLSNNENYSEKNFIKLNSPINRLSTVCFSILSDLITFVLPMAIFLLIISGYLLWTNAYLGTFFILSNIIIILYLVFSLPGVVQQNETYEKYATNAEFYLLEILNNIDKIIYRGEVPAEIEIFQTKTSDAITHAYHFYSSANNRIIVMNVLVNIITIGILYYMIMQFFRGKLSVILFITILNIIILYRDKMTTLFQQFPDFIEFMGRAKSVLHQFSDMIIPETNAVYKEVNIPFDTIQFVNVSFQYKTTKKVIFENLNLKISMDKIIGISGISGKGKSTLAKLILKMYNHYSGEIFIDNVNIKDLDANYIRKNITYVNQSSKLFDRKVIENIMYGCSDHLRCNNALAEIIGKYSKIRELFVNIDIHHTSAGSLGENLSGGQRQIVNIIGGLVNPSKILILDEPTNALDGELKMDVIAMIRDYKKNKKCIIVITHDKDIRSIFDESIYV